MVSDYFLQTNVEAGEQFLKAFDARCKQLVSFAETVKFIFIVVK
jgi:hypothetical protein